LNIKYKTFWRKTGLKKNWGNIFLDIVYSHKPKNFLEVGVFCGVTAKNICELLNDIHNGQFNYIGVDLFGDNVSEDEKEPYYLKKQKFSNPFKNIYYNYIKKENLNSYDSVMDFLKKFTKNIKLVKGNSNHVLKDINISNIDFAFIDGGHSYQTVYNDINNVINKVKKGSIILCDDYRDASYITGVKEAVDVTVKEKKLKLEIIKDRFAKITT
tara:strand:+ start:499 stop:1137 length:639 start_codon:yes stop_codon:yes gene_type:complete